MLSAHLQTGQEFEGALLKCRIGMRGDDVDVILLDSHAILYFAHGHLRHASEQAW
jgi:hypothetical protein